MVLWSRLRQSRFKFHAFSNDFRRYHNLNPAPVVANQLISSRKLIRILNYPKFIAQDEQLVLFRKVRFYARPVVKKKVEKDASEPLMNEEITAPMVRLVIDGENHIIVSRHEALARAESLKLDLVEVDKNGKPPVCKIFDYNKRKYVQQTKEKERSRSKSTIKPGAPKEVRFGVKIKQNDLKIKADMVKRLMEKGYRVKCTAADLAEGVDLKSLLSKFTPLIDDVAVVESGPKYEKKQAFVVVRHVKYGPVNKSSGKKASTSADSPQMKEDSDEDARTDKSEWAAFDGDDGGEHPIFEIDDVESGQLERSKQTASSIPSVIPKPATETPRPAYPPRVPMAMNGRGATNTTNRVPASPNQENQTRFGMNTSPRMRPSQQVEAPARATPKQASSSSTDQNSPPKSYGIFSVPKANAPAANRYQQNVPPAAASSPARNPRTTAASSPAADSRMKRGVGADNNSGQGRYGIFSAEERDKQTQKR